MTTDDPRTPRDYLIGIVENEDKEALHAWIEFYLKVNIPNKKICDDHDAPFDFVADYIFDKFKTAIVLANRNGGKTYDFAILDTIMSYLHPKVEIATVGAIQTQAQKCYNYFKKYTQQFPFVQHVTQQSMKRTEFDQEQVVEIVTGTVTGVNSPHPQLLFIDEIDLMLWFILQQAFSMPQSAHGIDSKMVLTSTRKFAGGVMQRALDEADEKGRRVYQWCIWEVIQSIESQTPEVRAKIEKYLGAELPKRITEVDGFYSWEDVIEKKLNLDPDVWEAEWLCKKPGIKANVYGTAFSEEENIIHKYDPTDKEGYWYVFEDFGFGENHPNVHLYCFVPITFDRLIVIDELYYTGGLTEDVLGLAADKLGQYGQSMPDEYKRGGTVKGWVGDPHGLTELEERRRKGLPVMENSTAKGAYIIKNGIPIVKKFLSSGRLMIHQRCTNLIFELKSYKYRRNLNGTYSDVPEKTDDHGPDALRYGLIALGDQLTYNWIKHVTAKDKNAPKTAKKIEISRKKPQFMPQNYEKPITAGLMDKKL